MENASKALLIAGAILLVIAIIAIGMSIFGQAQRVINDTSTQMDGMTISAHNSQLEPFTTGAIVKGSEVRNLITKMASYNKKISDAKYAVTITMVDTITPTAAGAAVNGAAATYAAGLTAANITVYSNIAATNNYVGRVTTMSTEGLVTGVTFTRQ